MISIEIQRTKWSKWKNPSHRAVFFFSIFFPFFSLEILLNVQSHRCAYGHLVGFNAFDSNWLLCLWCVCEWMCALCIKWSTNTHLNHNRWNEERNRCSRWIHISSNVSISLNWNSELVVAVWNILIFSNWCYDAYGKKLPASDYNLKCTVTIPYSSIHFSLRWKMILSGWRILLSCSLCYMLALTFNL